MSEHGKIHGQERRERCKKLGLECPRCESRDW